MISAPLSTDTSGAVQRAGNDFVVASAKAGLLAEPRWARAWLFSLVLVASQLSAVVGGALAAPACPADCDGNGSVVLVELRDALAAVLEPSSEGVPVGCPAVDADGNNDYGVEDLIRGATARGMGCAWVVAPAGWRGAIVDALSSLPLAGALLSANPWPLPSSEAQHPAWYWPGTGSSTPTPTPALRAQAEYGSPPLMRPGLPQPNVAFDPPAAACLPNTSATPAPSPGWQRIRVQRPGYTARVFYQPLEFNQAEMSFSTPSCTEGTVRPASTHVWPLLAQGTVPSEGLLPDIILDERQMVADRRHLCVDMPDGWQDLRILRLGIATANAGLGDLRLEGMQVGDCDPSNDVVEQWIALDEGQNTFRRRALPPGSIEAHIAHGHFHLRNWARFRLVKPTPGVCDRIASRPQSCVVRESEKLSFCIEDSRKFDREIGPEQKQFQDCNRQPDGLVHMGIQRGWSDVYSSTLFGQFIDTTGLSGTYWLEAEANLDGTIEEADATNNVVRVPVTFSTPQACVRRTTGWQCAASGSGCENLDCRNATPDCCPCPPPSYQCDLEHKDSPCWQCKDYFCQQDPNGPACLGPCGTCPVTSNCFDPLGPPVTPCASNTPTATPTAPTRTATRTPTPTRTPTGPTRTPTATPPTPAIPGLAVLIPDVEAAPGQQVLLDIYLAGSASLVGGLQFDLLLPRAALAALDVSPSGGDCTLAAAFSSTHRLRAAHAPDHPVAGYDRVRLLVVDRNVVEDPYEATDTLSDGVVVQCWITILSNAQRGSYALRVERARAGDLRGTSLWPFPGRSTLWVGGCSGSCC